MMTINLGENAIYEGAGVVVGDDTGRVIAKFSHEAEAEAFCRVVNQLSQPQEAVAVLIADPMFLPALNVPLMDWKVDVTNLPIGTELYTSQPNDKAEIARLTAEYKAMKHEQEMYYTSLLESRKIERDQLLARNAELNKRIAELEKDAERYCKLKSLALTAKTSKTFAISKFEENYWSAYELSPIDLDEELDKINYSNSTEKAKQLASDALAMK